MAEAPTKQSLAEILRTQVPLEVARQRENAPRWLRYERFIIAGFALLGTLSLVWGVLDTQNFAHGLDNYFVVVIVLWPLHFVPLLRIVIAGASVFHDKSNENNRGFSKPDTFNATQTFLVK